jgi:hypothetical protein
MIYNGVAYPYAFEVKVPVEEAERTFSIAISNYRDNTRDYTGLCLENELIVTSNKKVSYFAFYEIINKIEQITLESEGLFSNLNGGQKSFPIASVDDPEVLKVFEKCKKSTKSLEYYESLRNMLAQPESLLKEGVLEELRIDADDSPKMILFFTLFKNEQRQKRGVKFIRT